MVAIDAIRTARHDLATLNGLVATDRPDLWSRELAWVIDTREALAQLDAVLSLLCESDNEA